MSDRDADIDLDLYRVVEAYAGFGDHHTGTEADRLTTAWLTGVLQGLGAEVTLEPFQFERYIVEASLSAEGEPVPIAPVFYSGLGRTDTERLDVIELDRSVAGPADALDKFVAVDADPGSDSDPDSGGSDALVVAVEGPDDLPVWCNRVPWVKPVDERATGRAAVVVPANWAERIRAGARLTFEARLETTTSHNLVAALGSAAGVEDGADVIITTPLTGWTPAAGERGTGLATALAMAADLATDHRVRFVACSGHELDHIGMQHHLAATEIGGRPVIHLGASVGAVDRSTDGAAPLAPGRMMLTTAAEPVRAELATIAGEANWRAVDPPVWPGEGGGWRAAGASVLSFVGGFEHFQVTSDLPEAATTPEAVQRSTAVAISAARRFLEGRDR